MASCKLLAAIRGRAKLSPLLGEVAAPTVHSSESVPSFPISNHQTKLNIRFSVSYLLYCSYSLMKYAIPLLFHALLLFGLQSLLLLSFDVFALNGGRDVGMEIGVVQKLACPLHLLAPAWSFRTFHGSALICFHVFRSSRHLLYSSLDRRASGRQKKSTS